MSANILAADQILQETISKLETALLVPSLAGEMGNWVREVKNAAATLATDWTRELNTVLHPQYEQISQTDPEMHSQVHNLTECETALGAELVQFHQKVHELEQATSHIDWQESKLAAQQKAVEDAGLKLILQIGRASCRERV